MNEDNQDVRRQRQARGKTCAVKGFRVQRSTQKPGCNTSNSTCTYLYWICVDRGKFLSLGVEDSHRNLGQGGVIRRLRMSAGSMGGIICRARAVRLPVSNHCNLDTQRSMIRSGRCCNRHSLIVDFSFLSEGPKKAYNTDSRVCQGGKKLVFFYTAGTF